MSGYHYQKDPTWAPNDPRYREDTAKAAITEKRQRRLADFARWRDAGLSIAEAGMKLSPPVGEKRAYQYERDSKDLRKVPS